MIPASYFFKNANCRSWETPLFAQEVQPEAIKRNGPRRRLVAVAALLRHVWAMSYRIRFGSGATTPSITENPHAEAGR